MPADGYCGCGCGQKAPVSPVNHARLGYVKGQPRRYIRGHRHRIAHDPRPGPNPSGYCECGCGEMTPPAPRNNKALGWVKGKPTRFISGHQARAQERDPAASWDLDSATGCWDWTGARKDGGYGLVRVGGRLCRAHRVVYEDAVEPIPEGFHLHHDCGNPSCVNPDHLIPLSPDDHARLHAV